VPGTPDFINAVIVGIWHGPIDNLFSLTQKVEILSGRPENHSRYSDRTLDIDIIFFGELQIDTPLLTVPHPEAANRLFVLVPLEEVAGNWIFPGKDIAVSDFLNPLRNTEEFKSFQSAKLSEKF
jgi:2-amino-4-hydroxy-6-hydroxymethyldihydropteridine diphosphokinase